MINNNELLVFARAKLATFRVEVDQARAIESLKADIGNEFSELNSSDVKNRRYEFFEVPNTSADDYSEHLSDLGNGKKVIHGIRHFGMDAALPFVNLQTNFAMKSYREVEEVFENVLKYYKKFNPSRVRFESRNILNWADVGLVYLVAKANEITGLSKWRAEDNIEFQNVSDGSFYDWYKTEYKRFHARHPELQDKVPLNPLDDFLDGISEGLVKYICFEGERVGIIAAEKSDFLGHPGIYFNEIYVTEDHQRKGIAKAAQRKFVASFLKADDFVWGTIDYSNTPSYKTALSNSRRDVHFEHFISV